MYRQMLWEGYCYSVYNDGHTLNALYLLHTMRRTQQMYLTDEDLFRVIELVNKLPQSDYKGEVKDSLKIRFRKNEFEHIYVYDRKKLPKTLFDIFELLGGVREEIKEDIAFCD